MNLPSSIKYEVYLEEIGNALPVTGRGGPKVCETSRLPHFLNNRSTDGSESVRLMRRPPLPLERFLGLISVRR
jgi:hypothetical protein